MPSYSGALARILTLHLHTCGAMLRSEAVANKHGSLRPVGSSGDAYGRAGMLPSNGRGIRGGA